VLAVPVASSDNPTAIQQEADEVVCLEDYADFGAIGFYYSDFRQLADDEVFEMLRRFRAPAQARQPRG
jgi:predicted phosphoribosyltransferase